MNGTGPVECGRCWKVLLPAIMKPVIGQMTFLWQRDEDTPHVTTLPRRAPILPARGGDRVRLPSGTHEALFHESRPHRLAETGNVNRDFPTLHAHPSLSAGLGWHALRPAERRRTRGPHQSPENWKTLLRVDSIVSHVRTWYMYALRMHSCTEYCYVRGVRNARACSALASTCTRLIQPTATTRKCSC